MTDIMSDFQLIFNTRAPLPQVFEINPLRAWGAVATTVASVSLSIYLLAVSPWYLLPLVYAFTSAAWTGVSCFHHMPMYVM